MRFSVGQRVLLASVALSTLLGASELAQSQEAAPADTDKIEKVVVTAQRRSENLQHVPVTVTAFTAEQIEEARILSVEDIARHTPGLSFDAFPASQPRLAIRGIGSSDRGAAGDPSAAVFLDEVYLGRPAAVAFDVFDLERIEVLKGPQGTLFGRNVVGGAVNVITRAPDPEAFDASFEATLGSYKRFEGAGYVNLPFADGKAALRASGSWRTHDGFVRNEFTGGRLEDQDTRSGRAQLMFEPSDALQFHLTLDATSDRGTGPAQHVLDLDPTDPLAALWTVNRDRKFNAGETDGHQDRDTWGVRGQANWDLSFGTLNYLGSYRKLDYDAYEDFDGGNASTNLISIAGGNVEASSFSSHELRLLSPQGSYATWVVGLYSYNGDTRRDDILDLDPALGFVLREVYNQHAKLDSFAVYGDLTVPVTDRLNLIGGLRYTRDKKKFSIGNLDSDAPLRSSAFFDVDVNKSWNATTWRIGGDYHASDKLMFYGMVSRGFKSGGFQDTPETALDAATPFNPEFATQYEIGEKGEFLDGRVIWNNTLYWVDYTDLQTRQTVGLSIITTNAGAATIRGYETALTWVVGDGLALDASYAYTDATFDVFFDGTTDLSGNRISRTPKHKIAASASYTHDLGSAGSLLLAVDYQYESLIFDDNSNVGPEIRDPTHFVDGRAIFTSADENWSVSIWGKNLTDELTRTFQATFLGANFGAYNPPRTFGATLRWHY